MPLISKSDHAAFYHDVALKSKIRIGQGIHYARSHAMQNRRKGRPHRYKRPTAVNDQLISVKTVVTVAFQSDRVARI